MHGEYQEGLEGESMVLLNGACHHSPRNKGGIFLINNTNQDPPSLIHS